MHYDFSSINDEGIPTLYPPDTKAFLYYFFPPGKPHIAGELHEVIRTNDGSNSVNNQSLAVNPPTSTTCWKYWKMVLELYIFTNKKWRWRPTEIVLWHYSFVQEVIWQCDSIYGWKNRGIRNISSCTGNSQWWLLYRSKTAEQYWPRNPWFQDLTGIEYYN